MDYFFSLTHVFTQGQYNSPFIFYKGYTDNYMDYDWQRGSPAPSGGFYTSGDNKNKGKMFSLFKWQWDIIRADRSIIFSY